MSSVTISGLPELLARLNTPIIQTELASTVATYGATVQQRVRAGTPELSGALAQSEELTVYPDLAVISTALPYGPFIETGERSNPRARTGRVRRRAGAAHMFANAVASAPAELAGVLTGLGERVVNFWAGKG